MKLKQYLEQLNKLVEKDPSLLELSVYSAVDGEGNGFNSVDFSPTCLYTSKNSLNSYIDIVYQKEELETEIAHGYVLRRDYLTDEEYDIAVQNYIQNNSVKFIVIN